ncbi:MAG: alpha/beta hydrolase [Pseudomonadota bacterium]
MLPEVKAFLDEMAAADTPELVDLPVAEMRAAYAAMGPIMDLPGRPIAHVEDRRVPGPAGDIPIRLYDPAPGSKTPTRAVVFYHGGGFVIGNLDSHDSFARRLADGLGLPTIAVDYRLAPEHPFPAAADDCTAATQWAATQLSDVLGREVTGLVVCGDSAGGNLAAVAALDMEGASGAPIDLQVLLYPVTDLLTDYPSRAANSEGKMLEQKAMDFFTDAYDPGRKNLQDPRLSPLFASDVSGQPLAVVVVAELDPLHDEGVAYAEKLKAAGVRVTQRDEAGIIHGFYSMRGALPTAERLTDEMLADVKAALS